MTQKLPRFSSQEIAQVAPPKALQLGTTLAQRGAVEEVRARGKSISATVQDGDGAWHVRLLLGADGVEEAICACDAGQNGICCHSVALMLALSGEAVLKEGETPSTKTPITAAGSGKRKAAARPKALTLEDQLRERPAPELVELLLHLLEKDRKLKTPVEIWLRGGLAAKDLAAIRSEVSKELKRAGTGRTTPAQTVKNLQPHFKQAQSLLDAAPGQAGSIYAAILEGMLAAGTQPFDRKSDKLRSCADEVAQKLAQLAGQVEEPERTTWRRLVWQLLLLECALIEYGHFPLTHQALVEISPREWAQLETGLEEKIQHDAERLTNADVPEFTSFRWEQHSLLVDLWAARLERHESAAAAREMVARSGSPAQRFQATMDQNDLTGAIEVVRQFRRSAGIWRAQEWASSVCEAFLVRGQTDMALEVAEEFGLQKQELRLKLELDHPDAMDLAVMYLLDFPTPERWEYIMTMTPESSQREIFQGLWNVVQDDKHIMLRMQVLLWLHDWKAIRAEIAGAPHNQRVQLTNAVIGAVMEHEPDIAIALLADHVDYLLGRNKETIPYDVLRALQELKAAYKKKKAEKEWLAYVQDLQRRPNLPGMLPALMSSYRLLK